jgi:hypothetical protein
MQTEVPLETLAQEIVAHIEKGDKYHAAVAHSRKKAGEHYLSAGLQLIEAQKRLGTGAPFRSFCSDQCHLKKSRTNELIAIAKGTTTVRTVRAASAERTAKHRAKKAAAEPEATVTQPDVTVGSKPDLHTASQWAAKSKRIAELEAENAALKIRVSELEDILVTRDETIAALTAKDDAHWASAEPKRSSSDNRRAA